MPIPPALVQYKHENFQMINEYLRFGKIPYLQTAESMRNMVLSISNVMVTGNPVAPGAFLYRGTDVKEFKKYRIDSVWKLIGTTFCWKSFVSTSVEERLAAKFITNNGSNEGLLLQIQPNESTRFYDMSNASKEQRCLLKNLSNEKEVLLDHGTQCCIESVSGSPTQKHGKTYYIVKVRLT